VLALYIWNWLVQNIFTIRHFVYFYVEISIIN